MKQIEGQYNLFSTTVSKKMSEKEKEEYDQLTKSVKQINIYDILKATAS